jgi:hypothetical protein
MHWALARAAVGGPDHVQAPVWLGYLWAGMVLLVVVVGIWLLIWSARGWDFGEGDGDGGGDDGGGGGGPSPSPGPSPEGDPDWWPEFERALAAYTSARLSGTGGPVGPSRAGSEGDRRDRADPPGASA